MRWHDRGWSEKNQDYRDFFLSRFRGEPDILDSSKHTADNDLDWQRYVEVVIAPDPRLTAQQQEVVAHDFGMRDHCLALRARARLLPYLIKLLQIELNPENRHPRAQQVIILNQTELTPWLFESTSGRAGFQLDGNLRRREACLMSVRGILGFLPVCR